jgi:beta-hydroxylase
MFAEKFLHNLGTYSERMITEHSAGGKSAFFETASFPWVHRIEENWRTIRGELDALLLESRAIPNFQDISKEQAKLTDGEQWKTFFLHAYGHKAETNCARCPQTARLLELIPGMKTAMFSILAAGKHIPEHRGPYKGVLRYHLGLIIPPPQGACRIRVRDEVQTWKEGGSLIFDDSYLHEAWNDSTSVRVVLFVDIVRPLPFPISLLNRFMLWLISVSPAVRQAMENIVRPVAHPKPV